MRLVGLKTAHDAYWQRYERDYAALGPRFSFYGPCECFMCGKNISNPVSRNARVLIQVSEDGPCGNAHQECLEGLHTDVINRRFMEALTAALSLGNERPHPFTPKTISGGFL